ncbi:aminotransferase class V-fold PLP-dependent enzyme [Roseofilum casamattae]|uniref:Aminotransferase class V-fold PLP-dependent enzyme n=1 Tax=Roseofilum casamattae BLCC-M143 TaxID=3022442 RepID=A0ABT7BYL2_9CYAN|nr:aminotransferase class V-fold PLP-dependent enzyme [Roseofilum casamattae]MDJ1183368.1 aminotransferase class V-fold PLP-dependent enzyme [Roseofilum casamattae BLCC-M143]
MMQWKTYPRLGLDITWRHLISQLIKSGDPSERARLQMEIASYWPDSRAIAITFSARTAFDLLLQVLELSPGTEIIASAVNIRHMEEIAKFHQSILVPVDLELDTLAPNLDQFRSLISPQTRLCLIAHLFGSVIPLDPYLNLCHNNNILLIEDCAQAFAGSHYLGDDRADVSLFSFGSIKTCSALGGSVALIRDRQLARELQTRQTFYPIKSNWSYRKRLIKYCGLKTISSPPIYHQTLNLLRLGRQDIDRTIGASARGFTSAELIPQLRYQPATLLLNLLARRLQTCPSYQPRISKAKVLLEQLSQRLPEIQIPGSAIVRHSFWLFPILYHAPQQLMEQLRDRGFDATRGNTSIVAMTPTNGIPLPNATYLIQHLLYLPLSSLLPDIELLRLVECLEEFATNMSPKNG